MIKPQRMTPPRPSVPHLSVITTTDPLGGQLHHLIDELSMLSVMMAQIVQVVIVDDLNQWKGSPPTTCLLRPGLQITPVCPTHHMGQAEALFFGTKHCRAPILLTIDPDLHPSVKELQEPLRMVERNNLIIHGVRRDRDDAGYVRIIGSYIMNTLTRVMTQLEIRDLGCALTILRRDEIRVLNDMPANITNKRLYLYSKSRERVKEYLLANGSLRESTSQYSISSLAAVAIQLLRDCISIRLEQKSPGRKE